MRLILEISDAVRARVSQNFIVGIKVNSTEFQETGFQPEEARQLCAALEAHQVDFVELSGGTYEKWFMTHLRESTKKREAFFMDFADVIVPGLTKTRAYITGGLRTVGGMVQALATVDGVGMSRPLCQELSLCKDILHGKVQGAIIPKVEPGEFWLALMAGNAQMQQVGKGQEPVDLSDEDIVQEFRTSFAAWKAKKSTDEELLEYDWPETSVPTVPYAAAAVL